MVQHALEQLKELLGESSPFQGRLPNSISFKDLQQKLEEVQTAAQLYEEVLGIEGAVSLLGSGPRGDSYSHDVNNNNNSNNNNSDNNSSDNNDNNSNVNNRNSTNNKSPVWMELTSIVRTWCPTAFNLAAVNRNCVRMFCLFASCNHRIHPKTGQC